MTDSRPSRTRRPRNRWWLSFLLAAVVPMGLSYFVVRQVLDRALQVPNRPALPETATASPTPPPALPYTAEVMPATGLLLRQTADARAQVVAGLPQAERVTVVAVDTSGDWVEVKLQNGLTGWARADALTVIATTTPPASVATALPTSVPATTPAPPAGRVRITATAGLTLRSGADAASGALGTLAYNQEVQVLRQSGDGQWLQVDPGGGAITGWVSSAFTAPVETPASPTPRPVATVPPTPTPRPPAAGRPVRVAVEIGLILRDAPNGNRIGGLEYRQEVLILETSPDGNWEKVRSVEGSLEGWVKAGNTEPAS
ncbi:MAG: SH3 domain-containing protein [Gloeomargaritaceae cyanobacterium C42_A2020_066]|nr:SH3 domain-containing protein [Gloeomargaritaceae cyanobacterium C42_A2020_066]